VNEVNTPYRFTFCLPFRFWDKNLLGVRLFARHVPGLSRRGVGYPSLEQGGKVEARRLLYSGDAHMRIAFEYVALHGVRRGG